MLLMCFVPKLIEWQFVNPFNILFVNIVYILSMPQVYSMHTSIKSQESCAIWTLRDDSANYNYCHSQAKKED